MFVFRRDEFLTLERGPGRGEGLFYVPGGLVEPGEDPLAAAVRETEEESGLLVRDARILRVWTWPTPEGWDTVHATYVGWSDEGDVRLSAEHTAFRWSRPDDYIAEWCHEGMEAAVPAFAAWFRQVRANVQHAAAIPDPRH
jgi:8-oxo-dGTP pyrophosphatase MutT (NUDIX family)